MSENGLTPNGPNIKRLDTIMEDIHKGLSDRWGVNTRQNPESFLNHLLTNFADRVAELWEFGESIYYSQYPTFAEGRNLDNAAQYGGSTREAAAKSYYPIHCTGKEGTVLAAGTMISTTTNPTTKLSLGEERVIERTAFNKVKIKVYMRSLGAQENTDDFLSQMNLTVQQKDDSILFAAPADETGYDHLGRCNSRRLCCRLRRPDGGGKAGPAGQNALSDPVGGQWSNRADEGGWKILCPDHEGEWHGGTGNQQRY